MKTNYKFNDKSESVTIKTGERFLIEKDCNGFWGFTSDKGYNLWEGGNDSLAKTKTECKAKLREFEKIEVLNKSFE